MQAALIALLCNPRRTVTRSVRRVKLAMNEGYGYRKEFRAAFDELNAAAR